MPDKNTLLKEVSEVSFAVNDLTLYLDTHPTDVEALKYFHDNKAKRKKALDEFEKHFYPLTVDCIQAENEKIANGETKYGGISHWTWADGEAPWKGGCE